MKNKAEVNDKAFIKINGKLFEVLAKDEVKKRYESPPEYFCCGTDEGGTLCLVRVFLKISINGTAHFSSGTKVKHKYVCEYNKSTGERVIHPMTNDIKLLDMEEYFHKFSAPRVKKRKAPGPKREGGGALPKVVEEDGDEDIEIMGNDQLPKSISSLYGIISDYINTVTPMSNDVFPEDVIVNSETFFDFYAHPEKLDRKTAICVCFFKKFENGRYENAPVVNRYPAFTLVYPRNKSGNEAIHYCISFAKKDLYDLFKKKYLSKSHFAPMLIFAKWNKRSTSNGDIVFHATITSPKMLGRIKDAYKEEVEKEFLN